MVALILLLTFLALAVASDRTYLYVGGKYITNNDGEHIFTDQMYVEKLTPARVSKPHPIVFVHGRGQTGTVCCTTFVMKQTNTNATELAEQTRRYPRMGIVFSIPRL